MLEAELLEKEVREEILEAESGSNSVDAKSSTLQRLRNQLTMVAHFVCLLFTAFVAYTAQPGSSEWHPYNVQVQLDFVCARMRKNPCADPGFWSRGTQKCKKKNCKFSGEPRG